MPHDIPAVDDRDLLKLLEIGLGDAVAAKQIEASRTVVNQILREFLAHGILRCAGDREVVDWKAYGEWKRIGKTTSDTEVARNRIPSA